MNVTRLFKMFLKASPAVGPGLAGRTVWSKVEVSAVKCRIRLMWTRGFKVQSTKSVRKMKNKFYNFHLLYSIAQSASTNDIYYI